MSSRKPAIRREAGLPTPDRPAVRVQTRGGLANHEAGEPLNVLRVRHREGKGSASEGKANIGVFKTETYYTRVYASYEKGTVENCNPFATA